MSGMNRESEEMSQGIGRRAFCAVAAGAMVAGAAGINAIPAFGEEEKPADSDAASDGDDDEQWPHAPMYVADSYVCKPGDAQAFIEEYMSVFAPHIEDAGAEFVGTRVAPPFWLETDSNTVEFTWKVGGMKSWWDVIAVTRGNPEVLQWLGAIRERVVSLDRSYYADPADMEVLCNV